MVYFKKTDSAPSSLIKHTIYNAQDVLDMLEDDFEGKCYICESKGIEAINMEHFAPHKKINDIRKYSWSNLFWSCSHCNTIKSVTEPILNCTYKNDYVDSNIRYSLDTDLQNNKIIIENLTDDVATLNTVKLLTDVYNGTTDQNKLQARVKRNNLYDELSYFTYIMSKYELTEDMKKKKKLFKQIKDELSNESSFTAFKRWIIRDRKELLAEFENCIK